MNEVREDAHTVDSQVLSEQFYVVIDIAFHAQLHVFEQALVNSENALVDLLGENRVHALVESLREEDLISDEGGGIVSQK